MARADGLEASPLRISIVKILLNALIGGGYSKAATVELSWALAIFSIRGSEP
jgi:hypothetical protein